jgi:hypothetical protein
MENPQAFGKHCRPPSGVLHRDRPSLLALPLARISIVAQLMRHKPRVRLAGANLKPAVSFHDLEREGFEPSTSTWQIF